MRLPTLLSWLACVCLTGADRKAIPFGTPTLMGILESQEYMTQRLTAQNESLLPHPQGLDLQWPHDRHKTQQLRGRQGLSPAAVINVEDALLTDGDDDAEDQEISHNDAHAPSIFSLDKRVSKDCGIYRMDCAQGRAGCNNACYYQNCVMQGSIVRYVDGGGKRFRDQASENRVDAGTTTNPSSPCRMMPLSQKTYDQWPDWEQADPDIQMDEWPVAAMSQPEFSALSPGTVRNSLRCISRSDNSDAGALYKYFRRGISNYSKKRNGKYAHLRTCDVAKDFTGGETFTVDFDLSGMTDTEIDEIVPYCKPNPDCTNDGQQFHLSELNYVTPQGKAGRMGWNYDLERMNNYKVTGELSPVQSFQVIVRITGDDRNIYEAVASKFRDSAFDHVGTANSDDLRLDQSLTVTGLPRDLILTRRSAASGEHIDFVYGDPKRELAGFVFNTNDYGFSKQFDSDKGRYCLLKDLTDSDGDIYGQQYECWFAGW